MVSGEGHDVVHAHETPVEGGRVVCCDDDVACRFVIGFCDSAPAVWIVRCSIILQHKKLVTVVQMKSEVTSHCFAGAEYGWVVAFAGNQLEVVVLFWSQTPFCRCLTIHIQVR